MLKKTSIIISLLSLIIGLALFFWGTGFIRNYGGDAIVVVFLYSVLSMFWHASPWKKALTVFLFALTVEFLPLFIPSSSNLFHQLVIGSTVDPRDILTYFTATMLMFFADKASHSRFPTPRP